MKQYKSYGNYEKHPTIPVDTDAWIGTEKIAKQIYAYCADKKKCVVVFECYPGTSRQEIDSIVHALTPCVIIDADDCAFSPEKLTAAWKENLTDDRVFGKMTTAHLSDFYESERIATAQSLLNQTESGLCVVVGTGASLITKGDILVYCDLSRWEIQLRWRKGGSNWHCDNPNDPQLSKYKRGFFIEWRLADRLKQKLLPEIDFLIDTNQKDEPKLMLGDAFRTALRQTASRPFRTVPYFDPGVWGGQWMKQICGLPQDEANFAWSFDGVPEENSLLFDCRGTIVEIPAMDLILFCPEALLGTRVYGRFGAEFPIRFDFLDTMDGGNLSLQVHPLTEYIQREFGMHYTQDESYYLLDAEDDACVYLGVKEGVCPQEMINALKTAQETGQPFDAERYVNRFPAKKHDHFLIPAGTVHCSGKNAMVLEISATPYIFTFKLYDWGRLGLDGRPRPIHIEHGEQVIQFDRDTKWVKQNLINAVHTIQEDEHVKMEHTGLHALEFIETTRIWFDAPVTLSRNDSVSMLNLVEGSAAVISSPEGYFEPYTVHYAETFILPVRAGDYQIAPLNEKEKCAVIRAEVRG